MLDIDTLVVFGKGNFITMDVYDDELLQEVFCLRKNVCILEDANSRLSTKLKETQTLKLQLENVLLMQTNNEHSDVPKSKRSYNKRELTPAMKAFQRYYHENKQNPQIIANVKDNLVKMGYKINAQKDIPTQLIRMECLKIFDTLTDASKELYYEPPKVNLTIS